MPLHWLPCEYKRGMELPPAQCSSEPNWRRAGRACNGQPARALATNYSEQHDGSPAAQPAERWHEGSRLRAFERPNVRGNRRPTVGEARCWTSG